MWHPCTVNIGSLQLVIVTLATCYAKSKSSLSLANFDNIAIMRPFRNSHRRSSVRKGVLRNFAKFTENARLFFLFKKRLWHKCFPMNFERISNSIFFTEPLQATASDYFHYKITPRSISQLCNQLLVR